MVEQTRYSLPLPFGQVCFDYLRDGLHAGHADELAGGLPFDFQNSTLIDCRPTALSPVSLAISTTLSRPSITYPWPKCAIFMFGAKLLSHSAIHVEEQQC